MSDIAYLDAAARTPIGLDYKRFSIDALDIRPQQTVLDLDCGPGTDLGRLTATGAVVTGMDADETMIREARRRYPEVEIVAGDAHDLPFGDGTFDRLRTDRVLQHVADPGRVMAEIRRVLRPDGLMVTAEPDWDTLTVADADEETSRAFCRFNAGRVRNHSMGRHLKRLAYAAGFEVRAVTPIPVAFEDFGVADTILGLSRNARLAVAEGVLEKEKAEEWLARLAREPFLGSFLFYVVTASRP
ncbi:methyltransferase domain-containing protein [Hamadaea tsunoensis]|uniref:methyltransferase domain-containing protein n=1 Tax=Hamadaea tsunoensis TaxID=53368 RepID=UPI0003F62DCA|nr:methyltransferase domain-containing protein [Hamadaea tsunoensis]